MNNRQYDDYFYEDFETDDEMLERKLGDDAEWWEKFNSLTDEQIEVFISKLNDTADVNIDDLFIEVSQL